MSGIFEYHKKLVLESGKELPGFRLVYDTYGTLNAKGDNVVWICHALTANSQAADWWSGLVGEGKLFDPQKQFIVCANIIGSHYGSTGPLSINPHTGSPWYHHFPEISIRDIVQTLDILRQHLGIRSIHTLIGGSLGGQQAQEWAILQPSLIRNLILVATNARHSAWGIAFNEAQRMAIKADRTYFSYSPEGGQKGMAAARAAALLSYRHYDAYNQTQGAPDEDYARNERPVSYQHYQGEKLVKRFNAYSYVILSGAMDSHNVARGRGSLKQALGRIKAHTLVVSIDSDLLFPVSEQKQLADLIPGARHEIIGSSFGHDGFLIEATELTRIIKPFISEPVTV